MTQEESDENARYNREVIEKCDHEIGPVGDAWLCRRCNAEVWILLRPVNQVPLPIDPDEGELL